MPESKFQNDAFLARWVAGELTGAEAAEFEMWIATHPEAHEKFSYYRKTWLAARELGEAAIRTKEQRWHAILQAADIRDSASNRGLIVVLLAATIIIAMLAWGLIR